MPDATADQDRSPTERSPRDRSAVDRRDLRATHTDRERVLDRLRRAQSAGQLDVLEFDERSAILLTARTYGDLDALLADLPEEPRIAPAGAVAVPAAGAVERNRWAGIALRVDATGWAVVSSVTALIWLFNGLSTGPLYWDNFPWFLWIAGPWGAVLLVHAVSHALSARNRKH